VTAGARQDWRDDLWERDAWCEGRRVTRRRLSAQHAPARRRAVIALPLALLAPACAVLAYVLHLALTLP